MTVHLPPAIPDVAERRARARRASALYASAVMLGLVVVAYPASGAVLTAEYGLRDAEYGSLFVPQVAATVAAALAGSRLAPRLGLGRLLGLAGAAQLLSVLALAAVPKLPHALLMPTLWVGTACLGTGFGFAAAPTNTLPGLLFPKRAETALVAMHATIGVGLALGPLLVSRLVAIDAWSAFPVGLVIYGTLVLVAVVLIPMPREAAAGSGGATPVEGLLVRPLAPMIGIAILYAIAEGSLSNWCTIFLVDDRAVSEANASLALSAFWSSLVVGRIVVSALVARMPPERLSRSLLVLQCAAFLGVPLAHDTSSGIAAFGFAGLACSAIFPLVVGLSIAGIASADERARRSTYLTAALMLGVGVGSFGLGAMRASFGLTRTYQALASLPIAALLLLLARRRPAIDARAA